MRTLLPSDASSSSLYVKENKLRHLLFTAETHNFPTGMNNFLMTGNYCFTKFYESLLVVDDKLIAKGFCRQRIGAVMIFHSKQLFSYCLSESKTLHLWELCFR